MRVAWAMLIAMAATPTGAAAFAEPPWPELSAAARTQLETAVDGERPDEPAFYPLLLHMGSWDAGDVAAARAAGLPGDVGACLDDPAACRGAAVDLEARFAGRVREVGLLRGGPWGKTVTEWGLVRDGPKDAPGRVAVVYFPCPPEGLGRPRDRQRVRVAGRFFKTWTDVDAAGVATTYPVFVAAPFWEPAAAEGGVPWRGMVVLVLGLAAGLWGVRRVVPRAKSSKREAKIGTGGLAVEEGGSVDGPSGLPEDPAEALAVLRDRGGGAGAGFPPARE